MPSNYDTLYLSGDLNLYGFIRAQDNTPLLDTYRKAAALAGGLTGPIYANDGTLLINPATKAAAFVGGVTANLIGSVIAPAPQIIPADGAIVIPAAGHGAVALQKGSAAAITIPIPAPTDDGKILSVWTETAFAHVITQGTVGFNAKAASGTVTFTAAKGNSVQLIARGGNWWALAINGVTIA